MKLGRLGPKIHVLNPFHPFPAQATRFNFSGTILDDATMRVSVYLFNESGVLELGPNNIEEVNIGRGQLKFNVEIENWPWCTAGGTGNNLCQKSGTDQVGTMLDLAIDVKSKSKPSKSAKAAAKAVRVCSSSVASCVCTSLHLW